ncbi:MAG TPA: tetratricopeptide repeat protein [Polyangiaceae bacterium]|jgi:serine/threonine-protein kinase
MKRLVASLSCAALLAASLPAFADELRSARADALFHQGELLLEAGKVDAACSKFEASEAWENGLGTLLHLADCYERAGRTASAWHTFLEAEAVAQAKKDSEREQVAAERVAALEPKLARVVFVVPPTSRVPGLGVQLGPNTIPASSWGTMIPVDPGAQRITAFAKGHQSWAFTLDVSKNDGREYRVIVPTLEPTAEPVAVSSNRRAIFRTAGVVTGSVGLAGIGAGAVFSALSRNADDTASCAHGSLQCPPTKSNTASSYSEAAAVSFAVGGALLATGVTLFVLAPSPDNQEKHALRVAAHVASNGGRLQLEGAW